MALEVGVSPEFGAHVPGGAGDVNRRGNVDPRMKRLTALTLALA